MRPGPPRRVRALQACLADAYGPARAFEDGVVPRRLPQSPHFHRDVRRRARSPDA
ncbi:hypothetical protein ABZ461_21670 [Actinacidiphila glaucinigra]